MSAIDHYGRNLAPEGITYRVMPDFSGNGEAYGRTRELQVDIKAGPAINRLVSTVVGPRGRPRERWALQLADAQLAARCERGNDHVQMSREALISGGEAEMSCGNC